MAEKTFETQYFGTIIVRNAMFESENGTDLFEGIELKDEMGNLVEVEGYRDIDEMSTDEVEGIFSKYF
jgi:hypothetical protein